jgi:hypothetical protein
MMCPGTLKLLSQRPEVGDASQSDAMHRLHSSRAAATKTLEEIEARMNLDATTELPLFKPVCGRAVRLAACHTDLR